MLAVRSLDCYVDVPGAKKNLDLVLSSSSDNFRGVKGNQSL